MAPRGNPLLSKLARLRAALRTDRVLSAAQLRRDFDLDLGQLQGLREFTCFSAVVQPIFRTRTSRQIIWFVTLAPRLPQRLSPEQIGHLCGTAEIRLRLGSSPEQWRSDAAALGKLNKPDAVLTLGPHLVAIEFDTGSYRGRVVRQKCEHFAGKYAGLVWGVTSRVRSRRLAEALGPSGVQVLRVNWWGGVGADLDV
ncbi:hypothetical protein [Deinococcus aluminii]|uniref:DUF559 domain-containing protein n=1 Tax=Deinococcus aluminii TaxID=1656885 RepID=A0ABP9XJI4_9DEIO